MNAASGFGRRFMARAVMDSTKCSYWLALGMMACPLKPLHAAEAVSPGLKRWAIISSSSVRESGLADLVVTEFSRLRDVELVERDQLDLAMKELALNDLSGAHDTAKRLQLGKTLKADALLVLREEELMDNKPIRAVISECRQGARLRVQYFASASSERLGTALAISTEVKEVRARFSSGVKRIIGVSPFLSRDFTHEYVHNQSAYANLLQNALALFPGVAVIEVAEAEAIRHELELAGDNISRRVPVFVEGEFQTAKTIDTGRPTVTLDIAIKGIGAKTERIHREGLSFGEAAHFLSLEAPRAILQADTGESMISMDDQFSILKARAVTFARLGMVDESIGLREAALLLKEEDDSLRRLLVGDYDRLLQVLGWRANNQDTMVERTLVAWRSLHAHVDYLVMNGKITQDEYLHFPGRPGDIPGVLRRLYSKQLDPLKQEDAARRRALYSFAARLPPASVPEMQPRYFVAKLTVDELNDPWNKAHSTDNFWAALMALADQLPDKGQYSGQIGGFLDQTLNTLQGEDAKNIFLSKLLKSPHALNRFYGRYGLLEARRLAGASESLLSEARALEVDFHSWCKVERISPLAFLPFPGTLETLREDIARKLNPVGESALTRSYPPQVYFWGAIRMTNISFQLKTLDGVVKPFDPEVRWKYGQEGFGIQYFTQCGERLDVAWTVGAVLFHRTKGLLEEMIVDPGATFMDVKWDGENVWIATRDHGIQVIAGNGKPICHIGSEDMLPPSDCGLVLHPLAPGRVCAAGAFGTQQRVWLAIVELVSRKPAVKIFHTGTRVWAPGETRDSVGLDFTFAPSWMHAFQSENGKRDQLWIGAGYRGNLRPVLELDLNTLTVRWPPMWFLLPRIEALYSRQGEVLIATDSAVAHYVGPGKTWPRGNASRELCVPKNREGVVVCGSGGVLLPYGDHLYVPGLIWFRIDPKTMVVEQLTPDLLPQARSQEYALSAHYGIIGWNYRQPFRQFTITTGEAGAGVDHKLQK